MARKKVPLDEIRLGKEQEHDKTRYQQIQEERINRNFRRLQEDANDMNSHLTDMDSRLTDVDSRLSYIEDGNFDTPLNIIPRRAYATLSSAGWYRVAEFEPTSAYASYDVQGSIGALIRFFITRRYYWTGNETHEVTLSIAYTSIKWMDESSNSVVQGIDKIRYTTNSNTNKGFIDIHYTLSQANQTAVDFEVSCPLDSNGANYQEQIKSMDLTAVADAPVGETILTTYSFSASTDGVGTITAGSIGSIHADSWLVKRNNIVQGYCQTYVNGTLSSGWNIIGVLPSGFRPNAQYDYCGVENSSDAFMHIRLYPNGNIGVYKTISSNVSYIKVYFSFVL